ncbi:diguanylate cyclase (GGDEF)-like protein [Halanaerobium saccharolyticum]|uniref:Diguanylate cyclase (GGDEF)-like protein n=1 Tax=Halanaerobium saccharolyticum TaxID=43595 RepID=A0A4R6LRX0_9FIRM|nr:diguanylate cyclase (GGDEF)-like protein [Halanaerobium saccharolyticum]
MAYQDYLTELPNRARFIEYFEELVNKDKKTFSIIYLDLDRFKLINDSFGHDAGDKFLKNIAAKMKDLVGPEDMVARFSGDEFAFVFVDLEDLEQIKQKCREILKAIEEPWEYFDQEFQIKASAGIVNYPDDGENISILLRNVDLAMYYAKENDLDFKVFTDNLSENFIEQLTMENDLRMAVEKNELEVYYQPLLTLDTGKINTMEALLRWEYPKQGFISPAQFIPLAEKSGLIIPIGKWVLRQTCQQIKEWSSSYNKEMRVAVNISSIQIEQLKFIDDVRSIIKETGVDPCRLEFEITESVLMIEPELVLAKLNKLKELGIKISLDDFGTGYSSLSYLKKFPIDKLKIDRSFIMDLTVDNYETGIVKAILDLAKNMELTVTAEGVETLAQLNLLKKLKCDKIQGYYISRPIPAAEFEQEFLKKE